MKKLVCIICVLSMLMGFTACSEKKTVGVFATPEDVTIEALKTQTIPRTMLGYAGGFEVQWRYDDEQNGGAYASTTILRYRTDGELIHINQSADYDSGDHTLLYFTSDMSDPVRFVENSDGYNVIAMSQRDVQDELDNSLFFYDSSEYTITSSKKNGDSYQVEYDAIDIQTGSRQHVTMDVDPSNGAVTGANIDFYDGDDVKERTKVTITYKNDVEINTTPRDKAIEMGLYDPEESKAKAEAVANAPASSFVFAAKDMDGNLFSQNDLGDYKLLMVNFWEPWCQPCVGEMEDLEHLYEDYKDSGVVILGVLSSFDYDDDARSVMQELGITYPVVHADTRLALYETDSVPTTIFVDNEGNVLTDDPYIGARDYNDWLTIITDLMTSLEESAESDADQCF